MLGRSSKSQNLCLKSLWKMSEHISPKFQDNSFRDHEGKPIPGGHLFRKYLLNRCQEYFEREWVYRLVAN